MSEAIRRLVLLRHAKSARPSGLNDHERPLNGRGRRDATSAGRWLSRAGLAPDRVLCSDAVRTMETWRKARAGMSDAPAAEPIHALYRGGPDDVLDLVRTMPTSALTVLVVGHEPTMSATAFRLAGPRSDRDALTEMSRKFPTSGIAVLRFAGEWHDLSDHITALETFAVPRG